MSEWFVKTAEDSIYGPADIPTLVRWAEEGRIGPSSLLSTDRLAWSPATLFEPLGMEWLVELSPGDVRGPFTRKVVSDLFASEAVAETTRVYRLHKLPIDEDPQPAVVEKRVEVPVEKVVEKVVEVEKRVEVPVEKVVEKVVEVEKRVEVPVEKVVEKVVEVEKRVEVPVEKVVEKVVEVEKRVEVPVERVVEKVVEKVVEVEKIVEVVKEPKAEVVVAEVIEAEGSVPPKRTAASILERRDHGRLAVLEAAARRELSAHGKGFQKGLFGRMRP